MLKFKQIRKSIITKPPLDNQLPITTTTLSPLAFKKTKPLRSPLKEHQLNTPSPIKYQTTHKKIYQPLIEYNSDLKENANRNVTTGLTFSHLSEKPIFGNNQINNKRKMTAPQPIKNVYTNYDRDSYNTPTKNDNNLSFASLVQSKKQQNSHNKYMNSDRRTDGRQNSISKLKEKLFGLKRVISDPERTKNAQNGQTAREERKENIKQQQRQEQLRQVQTQREMAPPRQTPVMAQTKPTYNQEDIVRISIKSNTSNQSLQGSLNMSPYLF